MGPFNYALKPGRGIHGNPNVNPRPACKDSSKEKKQMAYLYETNIQRQSYHPRHRLEECEMRNPYAQITTRLGQVPATSVGLHSQALRLAEEMIAGAEARAWTRVEAIYRQLESMGDEAFEVIPNAPKIHCLGAEVADILGQTQLRQTRLVRERDSLEKAGEPINSSAFRKVFEDLDAIEKAYGSVTITPGSKSVSKKRREQVELIPVVLPSTPDQRRSIEAATAALKKDGEFNGLLPVGNYTLKSGRRPSTQSFTINAGTELTGKKRITVRWGN
jgi:hypothetical protein